MNTQQKPKIEFYNDGYVFISLKMLHLNEKHQLGWTIDSAGTANYHVGEAPDKRTIANAKKTGVDLSTLRGRQFKATDFKEFDKIAPQYQDRSRRLIESEVDRKDMFNRERLLCVYAQ